MISKIVIEGNGIECIVIIFYNKYGQEHRLDGHAVEYADGSKEWWLDNKQYTEAQFNSMKKEALGFPIKMVK